MTSPTPIGRPRAWAHAPQRAAEPDATTARGSARWSIAAGTIVLALVAVRVAAHDEVAVAVAMFAVGMCTLLVVSLRWPTATARVGRGARGAVIVALFGLLGLAAVVVPWLLRPVLGLRRFPPRATTPGTQWQPFRVRLARPTQPWVASGHWSERSARERWQPRVALLGLLLIGALVWRDLATTQPAPRRAYNLTEPAGVEPSSGGIPAAFADSPWYPRYQADLQYGATWLDGIQVLDGIRLPDFRSAYLNVRDGYRRSWTPPTCTCRRVTLWMYGASTTFGLGQRDGHTIVSELAREAWRHGIALDVVNKGIPGEEHWQEANRLRWDLTRHRAPDVVVFYDGASDIVGASWLNQQRLPDLAQPIEPLTEGFLASPELVKTLAQAKTGGSQQPPLPDGVRSVTPATVPARTPTEVGRLAASRYRRALTMSEDLTAIHGLQTHWFWQPTRLSRDHVRGEPTTDLDDASRTTARAAAAELPSTVVDLDDALDGSDAPMFTDDVHHNELGARLIARAMYRELAGDLKALSSKGPGG